MIDWKWILKYRILHRPPTEWAEPEVIAAVTRTTGNLFIDIGSNTGFYSKLAKKTFRKVVSIEPDPRWGYNHPLRLAISNHKGKLPVFKAGEKGLMTLNRDFHVHGLELPTFALGQVDAVAFDDLQMDADMVKIDVEGAEFEVLEGMNKHLPKQVIIELHDENRAEELTNKLIEKGYDVSSLSPYHYLGVRQ